ncbi:MAG: HAMP domain-containing histidine kinase [Cyanobacteria bacterium SIG29]|nr:HAMP domain-containing histidine kinase [Cyanobacteria bacterium SIG29]
MKRNYLFLLLATIAVVYICLQQTNYINSFIILTFYSAYIFVYLNKQHKNKKENNKIIAALTHDLKTPAIAQIRAIELILKGNFGEINDNQRGHLNDILNSCNIMLDMLLNMLWLYKFDNKMIVLNIKSFCINELIQEIFRENKLMLTSKKQIFKQNYTNAKIYISADRMHIKRIISNLLINAINHSKENSTIRITSKIENNKFIFKVTNEGAYISQEILKSIFDKKKVFSQKSDCLSTGLGLYLSNSLLELNGGEILCKSSIDGTNTFGFIVNLDKKITNKIAV